MNMRIPMVRPVRSLFAPLALTLLLGAGAGMNAGLFAQTPAAGNKRPMTFLDMQHMRTSGSPAPSPDGRWLLYTVSFPDWTEARRQTDIFMVSLRDGLPTTRQLTFTREKNESSPLWSRDGRFFVFASNRDAPAST
jgi:Tol biopolymer transport system component